MGHYLDRGRVPPKTPAWSIRHRGEQARYCEKYIAPVLGRLKCSQITPADFDRVLARASTPSVAEHLRRCLTALAAAGVDGGYLVPDQAVVRGLRQHCAAGEDQDRAVMPEEVPPDELVHALAAEAGRLRGVWWRELEVLLTAYSGLRFGEHAALRAGRVDVGQCRVTVAEQVIEPGDGPQSVTMPKGRKRRVTVYPETTPCGADLAGMVGRRVAEVGGGLLFPAPQGGWLRRSNFGRNIWTPAAAAVAWPRDPEGQGWLWTFHSLRHVFASWALGLPGVTIEDVSRFMGHSSPRVTAEIYVHLTRASFDRFHQGSARAAAGAPLGASASTSAQLTLPLAV